MPINLDELCALRPFVFHVCGPVSFEAIKASRLLRSAKSLLGETPHQRHLLGRRDHPVRVAVNDKLVELQDHRPLVIRSMSLPDGFTVDDFVDELNARVFLWAGTRSKPVRSGVNHIARYLAQGVVHVLRMPLAAVIRMNPDVIMDVTFCNSGSARHHQGRPVSRGPDTFMPLSSATRKAAEVVEITYRKDVAMPPETEYAASLDGPWVALPRDV